MFANLDIMCEEARLEANIALQLQLEEERLRLVQVAPLQPRPPSKAEAGAPAAAPAPGPTAGTPAPLPPHVGFTSSPLCLRPPALRLPEGPAQDGGHLWQRPGPC